MPADRKTPIVRVAEGLAVGAGWALLGLSLLVTFEILARKLFAFSTQGADEIGGYVLAVAATVGFSYALLCKAHIRIDALVLNLPVAARAVLDIMAFVLLNLFVWLLAWRAWAMLARSWELGARAPTPLGTPMVVPQGLWVAGLVFFGVLVLVTTAVSIRHLVGGRAAEALIELDRPAMETEIEQEIADAARRAAETKAQR